MGKKGQLSLVGKITILLIFLGVVLAFYFFNGGLLPKLAKAGENLADSSLSGLKKDRVIAGDLESDKEMLEYYETFLNNLKKQSGNCNIDDRKLPSKFRGYKISLSKVPSGTFLQLINKDGQVIRTNTITECTVQNQIILEHSYLNW